MLDANHNTSEQTSSIAHHSFKFTVNTTVSMESSDLVCAKTGMPRQSCAKSYLKNRIIKHSSEYATNIIKKWDWWVGCLQIIQTWSTTNTSFRHRLLNRCISEKQINGMIKRYIHGKYLILLMVAYILLPPICKINKCHTCYTVTQ